MESGTCSPTLRRSAGISFVSGFLLESSTSSKQKTTLFASFLWCDWATHALTTATDPLLFAPIFALFAIRSLTKLFGLGQALRGPALLLCFVRLWF